MVFSWQLFNEKESYGYEMAERLSEYGFGTISEGTIYHIIKDAA